MSGKSRLALLLAGGLAAGDADAQSSEAMRAYPLADAPQCQTYEDPTEVYIDRATGEEQRIVHTQVCLLVNPPDPECGDKVPSVEAEEYVNELNARLNPIKRTFIYDPLKGLHSLQGEQSQKIEYINEFGSFLALLTAALNDVDAISKDGVQKKNGPSYTEPRDIDPENWTVLSDIFRRAADMIELTYSPNKVLEFLKSDQAKALSSEQRAYLNEYATKQGPIWKALSYLAHFYDANCERKDRSYVEILNRLLAL